MPIVTGLALLSAFMRRNPARLGYRYKRVMESYSDGLVGGPELEMSLSLVPCKVSVGCRVVGLYNSRVWGRAETVRLLRGLGFGVWGLGSWVRGWASEFGV